jgi:hypothetical protein
VLQMHWTLIKITIIFQCRFIVANQLTSLSEMERTTAYVLIYMCWFIMQQNYSLWREIFWRNLWVTIDRI